MALRIVTSAELEQWAEVLEEAAMRIRGVASAMRTKGLTELLLHAKDRAELAEAWVSWAKSAKIELEQQKRAIDRGQPMSALLDRRTRHRRVKSDPMGSTPQQPHSPIDPPTDAGASGPSDSRDEPLTDAA